MTSNTTRTTRRRLIVGGVSAALVAALAAPLVLPVLQEGGAPAADPAWSPAGPGVIASGPADAPVRIEIYSSLTCGHCRRAELELMPEVRSDLPGDVRELHVLFPLDRRALQASRLAACVPEGRRMAAVRRLYETQARWARAPEAEPVHRRLMSEIGMDGATFDACLADAALERQILETTVAASNRLEIRATPTFRVVGPGGQRMLVGVPSKAGLLAAVAEVR